MKEFRISLPNRPGELAKVAKLLGDEGINIETIAGIAVRDESVIVMLTDNEEKSRALLEESGVTLKEAEVLVIDLKDRPGELGKVAGKLGDAGVKIESNYLLRKERWEAQLALIVDNLLKAKEILS